MHDNNAEELCADARKKGVSRTIRDTEVLFSLDEEWAEVRGSASNLTTTSMTTKSEGQQPNEAAEHHDIACLAEATTPPSHGQYTTNTNTYMGVMFCRKHDRKRDSARPDKPVAVDTDSVGQTGSATLFWLCFGRRPMG